MFKETLGAFISDEKRYSLSFLPIDILAKLDGSKAKANKTCKNRPQIQYASGFLTFARFLPH